MTKTIVCLANSRKSSGRCIAGKEILGDARGCWVRPISARPSEEISEDERQYENGTMPEVLDIIQIPLKEHKTTAFQRENYVIDETCYWEKVRCFEQADLNSLLDAPDTLWGTDSSSYQGAGAWDRVPADKMAEIKSSLYLIAPNQLKVVVRVEGAEFNNAKRKVRASFEYRDTAYLLPVTDPKIVRAFLDREDGEYDIDDQAFMCVSLALPHTDGYCYKLAASIIGI